MYPWAEEKVAPLRDSVSRDEPSNNAMQLTGRPGTHLAVSAPPHSSSKGGAQGARPSRPAADRGRYTIHMMGALRLSAVFILLGLIALFYSPLRAVGNEGLRYAVTARKQVFFA